MLQGGAATQYDRSLFQRLEQCGHPVHLLNVQYRMHPSISAFPRAAFYDSKLMDGPNVLQLDYSKPYHKVSVPRFLTVAQQVLHQVVRDALRISSRHRRRHEPRLAHQRSSACMLRHARSHWWWSEHVCH